jgi:L-asparaginase type II
MARKESRRRFLKDMTALGAAGGVSAALAASAHAQGQADAPRRLAQAQPQAGAAPVAAAATGLPRVQLLIGPGTLPSVGKDRMDLVQYRKSGNPRMTGEQMLAQLPEIAKVARVDVDKGNPYDQASYDALRKLALRIDEVLRSPEVDGAVYVQGTNTIEETAYFLNLTVHSDKPLVVTGAQRPFNGLSSDAQMNLLDAVRLAGAPAARGKGALVAFNGEINAAREVTKTDALRLNTFQSRGYGVLGVVDADRVVFYRNPVKRHTSGSEFDVSSVSALPRVDVLLVYQGAEGDLIKAAVDAGAKGIVIAGAGAGATSGTQPAGIDYALAKGVFVVTTTRTGSGRIAAGRGGRGRGGAQPNDAQRRRIAGEDLQPVKARVLLMLALARTTDPAEIQRMFTEY